MTTANTNRIKIILALLALVIAIIIKSIIGLVVILALVFFINKVDFPAPKKEIEKIIPNENFKIVK